MDFICGACTSSSGTIILYAKTIDLLSLKIIKITGSQLGLFSNLDKTRTRIV